LIDQCKNQWQEVLSEHKNYFCSDTLTQISQNINDINKSCFINKQALIHGGFHCNNLLIDDSENIFVYDWQDAGVGDPAGDLSFFISRLGADGCQIDENKFIPLYCNAYNDQVG